MSNTLRSYGARETTKHRSYKHLAPTEPGKSGPSKGPVDLFTALKNISTYASRPHPGPSPKERRENYCFTSIDESGRVCRPNACGFSPMIAAANQRGT